MMKVGIQTPKTTHKQKSYRNICANPYSILAIKIRAYPGCYLPLRREHTQQIKNKYAISRFILRTKYKQVDIVA